MDSTNNRSNRQNIKRPLTNKVIHKSTGRTISQIRGFASLSTLTRKTGNDADHSTDFRNPTISTTASQLTQPFSTFADEPSSSSGAPHGENNDNKIMSVLRSENNS